MHPAVDGDMNGNRDFLAVQFFRIRKVDECLRESIGFQLLCPANVGKPENQDLTPDSVAAKRNALINGGDGEGLYPGFFQVLFGFYRVSLFDLWRYVVVLCCLASSVSVHVLYC